MGIDIKAERDELAATINDAVAAIRAALAEVSDSAAARRDEAAEAVKQARATADRGVESLSETVVKNPLAALAIAAGAGFILAHLTRGER